MIDKMITEKTEEEMKNFTKNMIWFCAGVYITATLYELDKWLSKK